MLSLIRTDSTNSDFITLVSSLDKELSVRDGDEYSFYAQFNKLDLIKHVIVAYENDEPVGCGAIKQFDDHTMEVKRMFVPLDKRGRGIATKILLELEMWCREMGFSRCLLETGEKQPEAIQLYKKNHYKIIPNYGQYAGVDNSICFEKLL